MLEPFIGEIQIVAFNYAPRGWALCNGQFLPINQNQALFSILGTTYGGNGQTTFALPDFRSRQPMHWGSNMMGLSVSLGQRLGTEAETITASTLPAHVHALTGLSLQCSSAAATNRSPVNRVHAMEAAGVTAVYSSNANSAMSAQAITEFAPVLTAAGGGQPHTNLNPYLTLNFVIALQGIFPSQN
jgi:microcystin-dependent protein